MVQRYTRRLTIVLWFSVLPMLWQVCTFSVSAQQQSLKQSTGVRWQVVLDTAQMRIGEHVHLQLRAEYPTSAQAHFPMFNAVNAVRVKIAASAADTVLGGVSGELVRGLEIVEQGTVDSTEQDGRMIYTQKLTLTSFDPGTIVIPPIPFRYRLSGENAVRTVTSIPLELRVHSVSVDSTQGIKDIKSPLDVPVTVAEWLPTVAVVVLLLAAVGAALWYLSRRKPEAKTEPAPAVPMRPAHEVALEALERLKEQRLWQQDKPKEYHSEIAQILWTYLEQSYGIKTIEATTDEILMQFRKFQYRSYGAAGSSDVLKDVLQRADLVKFARYQATPEEHERSLSMAFEFVKMTMPIEAVELDAPR